MSKQADVNLISVIRKIFSIPIGVMQKQILPQNQMSLIYSMLESLNLMLKIDQPHILSQIISQLYEANNRYIWFFVVNCIQAMMNYTFTNNIAEQSEQFQYIFKNIVAENHQKKLISSTEQLNYDLRLQLQHSNFVLQCVSLVYQVFIH